MKWKIYYIDGSSFGSDDPILGQRSDVSLIPEDKRQGVHSIIQQMGLTGVERETIANFHFIYFKSVDAWAGVGFDGLIDHLIHSLGDIGCVLNGRPWVADAFYPLRQAIAKDRDVIGYVP